jgi:3'(2'), 5'-bisphosphate nucleotidase
MPVSMASALKEALFIVQRAAYLSKNVQAWATKDLAKDDASPVTVADFAAQALIIEHLRKCFPNDRFVAEESSEV